MAVIRTRSSDPELWGGIECTINRTGDLFTDQLQYTGCYQDESILSAVLDLGITKMRFPVLWELHQPLFDTQIDWCWSIKQLNLLREKGVEPIVGLLHHGSGPAFTNLLDPQFPKLFAAYAAQVAQRFPWVKLYTPVNEPLTTARFSGLYGLWYPHYRDDASFVAMLLNQIKATALAMEAIREVNPEAQLVQTEDLGKVHSTIPLYYQRDFENTRRWLGFDLLCGKVDEQHPLWAYLMEYGASINDLQYFQEHPCVPSMLGLNYYITSERFLDHRLERYPGSTHGGNGKEAYADVEAVRVKRTSGLKVLLEEVAERYDLPMAITEAHLQCTREEQLRWFLEIWRTARYAKRNGLPVQAVTAWSLLGAYDWNSLLTCHQQHYETGAFDHGQGKLRKTALATLIQTLASGQEYDHPVVQQPGWWHRTDARLFRDKIRARMSGLRYGKRTPPLLIVGKTGTLGSAFARICEARNIPFVVLSRKEVDILDLRSVDRVIDEYRPWALINATGYVRVDDAETDHNSCYAINVTGASLLASACGQKGLPYIMFSSDLVFDGEQRSPYLEEDRPLPLNIYGKSKLEAEQQIGQVHPQALIIRSSSFFGPWDPYNFVYQVQTAIKEQGHCRVGSGMIVSPTYVPDLAHQSLDLLIDNEKGIWHVCNKGSVSWYELACEVAMRSGYAGSVVHECAPPDQGWKATRPAYSVLESARGISLPSLQHAMDRYFHERII